MFNLFVCQVMLGDILIFNYSFYNNIRWNTWTLWLYCYKKKWIESILFCYTTI